MLFGKGILTACQQDEARIRRLVAHGEMVHGHVPKGVWKYVVSKTSLFGAPRSLLSSKRCFSIAAGNPGTQNF